MRIILYLSRHAHFNNILYHWRNQRCRDVKRNEDSKNGSDQEDHRKLVFGSDAGIPDQLCDYENNFLIVVI